MAELPDLERAKLDTPLATWYADDQRDPEDRVYIFVKCHSGSEPTIERLIEEGGGTLRGHGRLERALRARVNHGTLGQLARHHDVVGVEMVHRSSEFNISPFATQD